ncbi:MAG: Methylmalonyl-CoA mutase, partial [uncultured Gemmatimonadaceae bacterium]
DLDECTDRHRGARPRRGARAAPGRGGRVAAAVREGVEARHALRQLGRRGEPGVHRARPRRARPRGRRDARNVPVHPRDPPHRLPRQALDDAPVRRLRLGARHQRPVQVPPLAGADGALGGVRLPDAHGLRRRPPALRGRGGEDRGEHLQPGRHGDAVRRHPVRQGVHEHDDQRPRRDPLLLLRGRGGEAGGAEHRAARHGAERHPQGVHGAARVGVPHRARAAPHRGLVRVVEPQRAALEHHLDLGLPHPRGRLH